MQVLEANLRRVLAYRDHSQRVDGPELRALSRAALQSYARYWLEVFRLSVTPVERLVSGMRFQGPNEATLFANLKAGRGVIIALPHMGNFEQAGAWVIARGAGKFTTVAERLRPESVYESFLRFRRSLGFEVLPLTGGASPFGTLAHRLRGGGLVCLVSDRDLKESGVEVEMFGQKARISAVAALAALPHMGNFEQAGVWVIQRGAGKFTTVAERLKPESVYESFLRFRSSLGFEVLPLTGGGSPFGTLAQRLRAGGLVCLVSDRDLKESGVEVEMFGEKARISAVAALAVHTGAALMPTATWFDGEDWGARIYDEIPVPETGTRAEKVAAMSQQLADRFAEAIAEHPEDWHMLQKVFVSDLDPDRLPPPSARVPAPRSSP